MRGYDEFVKIAASGYNEYLRLRQEASMLDKQERDAVSRDSQKLNDLLKKLDDRVAIHYRNQNDLEARGLENSKAYDKEVVDRFNTSHVADHVRALINNDSFRARKNRFEKSNPEYVKYHEGMKFKNKHRILGKFKKLPNISNVSINSGLTGDDYPENSNLAKPYNNIDELKRELKRIDFNKIPD